ncbi:MULTISPECIES: hypothetical protein [unclassified Bradyrhizobium]|uniref:hypothetical protein n=1 Tax=unclassified Bradyrhizobium TaxID=2631580 RepID=UPI0029162800|nr:MULTISPECIES: hypothetical protein [unclassified Bradyrhizobium]
MSYTPPDFMDDLNRALNISLDTDDCELQATAAINEVDRLRGIETLLRDNLVHIIAALEQKRDSDANNERESEAEEAGTLICLLRSLPDQAPAESYAQDDDEEEEEEDGNA